MRAALGTGSEEALLVRQLGAQREEQERVCQSAEAESASEEGWMGQQHSPLVLKGKNFGVIFFLTCKHKNRAFIIPTISLPSGHDLGGPLAGWPCIPGGTPAGPGGAILGPTIPKTNK